MGLAALIAAYHESGEPALLRATLPLAGRTVIERQARLAAGAGANPVIILVERMPPPLTAAIDRLRRDRVPVLIARSADEAADAVDPFDRLLVIADGAIAPADQLARIADGEGALVLTVADGAYGDLYERIDAESRWAGISAVSGAMLRDTAAMLRDWDLQSTLLRRTLQAGARHVAAEGPVAILDRAEDLAGLERRILDSADGRRGPWAERALAPLERIVTSLVMASPATPTGFGLAAVGLSALGAGMILWGWFWAGLILLLVASPLDGIAARLARLRMQDGVRQSWWAYLLPLFGGGAMIGMGYGLAASHGWGMVLLVFTAIAFLFALRVETARGPVRGAALLAERKGMVWLMLPFAIFGQWHAGLALLFAYAAASFFWAQGQAHRVMPVRHD